MDLNEASDDNLRYCLRINFILILIYFNNLIPPAINFRFKQHHIQTSSPVLLAII